MIRIYLEFLNDIKTLLVTVLRDEAIMNTVKERIKTGELRIKSNLGEKIGNPAIKRRVIMIVTMLIIVNAVLIKSLLFFSAVRNRTRAVS